MQLRSAVVSKWSNHLLRTPAMGRYSCAFSESWSLRRVALLVLKASFSEQWPNYPKEDACPVTIGEPFFCNTTILLLLRFASICKCWRFRKFPYYTFQKPLRKPARYFANSSYILFNNELKFLLKLVPRGFFGTTTHTTLIKNINNRNGDITLEINGDVR